MPCVARDVIVLSEEDDAGTPQIIAPLSVHLADLNSSRTGKRRRHEQSFYSHFKSTSSASPHPTLQDSVVGNPRVSQANGELPQASSRAQRVPCLLDSALSDTGTEQTPQSLAQCSVNETSKAFSLTKNMDHLYFATPSWSFKAPVESFTPSKSTSTAQKTPDFGGKEPTSDGVNLVRSLLSSQGSGMFMQPMMTDLAGDDNESSSADEEALAQWMAQDAEGEMSRSLPITSDPKAAGSRRSSVIIARNPPIRSPFITLDDFTFNGIRLAEKVYVELEDQDFLRVVHIIQDTSTSAVTLRGWKFRRTRELNGLIDKKLNEVCWILHVDDDDPRDAKLQGMETVPVDKVVKRRRIRLTNQSFPALSWRDDKNKENPETIESDRVLVCRFKYICSYVNAKARVAYEWHEKGFHRLRQNECDQRPDNSMKDEVLRSIWRGNTVPGGSQQGWLSGEKEFLRQEDVSHKGIASRASLKAPFGPDFPVGDPMKRGSVGFLVTEAGLQRGPDRETQSSRVHNYEHTNTSPPIRSDDHIKEVSTLSNSRIREQRQDERASHLNFSGFNNLPTTPSDCDIHKDNAMSALRRDVGQDSLQPIFPKVVEADAHVKTSSSSGTFEKRYEGRITSNYYPTPRLAPRKRSADVSLGSPVRPTKKTNSGFQAEPDDTTTAVDEGIIDLTRPQANPCKLFAQERSSMFRQASPSSPMYAHSPLPSHNNRLPLSGEQSTQPISAQPPIKSNADWMSIHPDLRAPLRTSLRQTRVSRQHNRSMTKSHISKVNQRRYTFGDCFCGAGGMSRGAVSAGLRVNWGFDFNLSACQSYQMNFFGTPIYNIWANQFSEAKGNHKVDICHLSPPCQFFSDAHTVQGKDDDMNTASLFAIFNLLEKAKPRIVTLEQTSGLIRRHAIFFNAVINMFTSRGFSVRWKVMNCADFGLPQRRTRLFIIASCPGEALPPFPTPTHSSNPEKTGLKPWTTINETIGKIPHGWANHDIHLAKERKGPSQLGDRIATCITTSGGGLIHPSGTRDYTLRELACLQSFPLGHKFGSSGVKKQTGNAVPPAIASILLETVKNFLLKADGLL